MDKNVTKSQTFTLTVNEFGEEIYRLQSDKTKSYIIDDHGHLSRYHPPPKPEIMSVKAETHGESSNDGEILVGGGDDDEEGTLLEDDDDDIIVGHHDNGATIDTSNLEVMNSMDSEQDFENNLMHELDTDLMNIDSTTSAHNTAHIIMQHMDIREPLTKLKELLEQRLGVDLPNYTFCLQGIQTLNAHQNLVDQCVQGEGTVQINVQLQTNLKKINILDVLKPAEDYIDGDENQTDSIEIPNVNITTSSVKQHNTSTVTTNTTTTTKSSTSSRNIVQWQVDSTYRKSQDRLKIPHDPIEWTDLHVRHWVQWAVRQFNLPNIKLSDWSISGQQLYQLTLADFHRIVPNDPGDVFWTHLELLRKMKVVAVKKEDTTPSMTKKTKLMRQDKVNRISPNYHHHNNDPITINSNNNFIQNNSLANRAAGNNGQIQLWQFLLELLTSRKYNTAIHWIGQFGHFKLKDPHVVAQLWGERKNKPHMNYEKLSRALRYYYDGDMISKVHGERFVYKFVCDLKQLLGYSAQELANLVEHGDAMYNVTRPEMFTMLATS